jgi:hypothetical protein
VQKPEHRDLGGQQKVHRALPHLLLGDSVLQFPTEAVPLLVQALALLLPPASWLIPTYPSKQLQRHLFLEALSDHVFPRLGHISHPAQGWPHLYMFVITCMSPGALGLACPQLDPSGPANWAWNTVIRWLSTYLINK